MKKRWAPGLEAKAKALGISVDPKGDCQTPALKFVDFIEKLMIDSRPNDSGLPVWVGAEFEGGRAYWLFRIKALGVLVGLRSQWGGDGGGGAGRYGYGPAPCAWVVRQ